MTDAVWGAILAALLGGLLTIAGGLIAAWLRTRNTRRTRMNAIIAEQKVRANAEAYRFLKEIERQLIRKADDVALALIDSREEWLSANRLFLPAGFPDTWQLLKTTVHWLVGAPFEGPRDPDNLHRLKVRALRLVKQALQEISADMGMEEGHSEKQEDA